MCPDFSVLIPFAKSPQDIFQVCVEACTRVGFSVVVGLVGVRLCNWRAPWLLLIGAIVRHYAREVLVLE
jgi:hypothetical protein